ncbi:zinc metalloproteinase nas-1-like [Diabrotica virgifera virgifera]|uniref:Metalloendopeptidase n=1 Tax=Diabrotica virgifera virgifera TaxID=50390 RepID=A0ABM5JZ42_DIAVI|nr:zinc metalloproteinase nas-1-like [Diabrotica virgifera virgifera]
MQRLLVFVFILHVTDVNALQLKNFKVGECTYEGERKLSPEPSPCSSSTKLRTALTDRASLWDNGRVPYVFNGTFTDREKKTMQKVMELYQHYTCIKFVPKTKNDKFYAIIVNDRDECCSELGKLPSGSRPSVITLGPSCFHEDVAGTVIHEFMHLIGFYHEFVRSDRDNYIEVTPLNILPKHRKEFKIESGNTFNIPYDYDSIMHYSVYQAAIQYPLKSFVAKDKSVMESRMGQICGFSKGDITKINIVYNCPQKTADLNLQDDVLYGVDISTVEVKYEILDKCEVC